MYYHKVTALYTEHDGLNQLIFVPKDFVLRLMNSLEFLTCNKFKTQEEGLIKTLHKFQIILKGMQDHPNGILLFEGN